jgi:chaperone modulatory protein CbpM
MIDFDLDEPLTLELVAECIGTKRSLIAHLARSGLIETVASESGETLVPRRTIIRLRRMQRLRRDLGVNFAGAAVIIDLVGRIEELRQELRRVDWESFGQKVR